MTVTAPLSLPRHGSSFSRPTRTRAAILAVAAGLALGIGTAWMSLGEEPPFGAVEVGPWKTWPRLGSIEVDPYSRALLARAPHMPLAAGEGLTFMAQRDSEGRALLASCRYRISGATLPSRGWTLTVLDADGRLPPGPARALSDADIFGPEGQPVALTASARMASGPWLPLPASGRFGLALRFYDTPLSANAAQLAQDALPRIERQGCDG
jgi:hypothetical protein